MKCDITPGDPAWRPEDRWPGRARTCDSGNFNRVWANLKLAGGPWRS